MTEPLFISLIAPALLLGVLAWFVPRLLARVFPEGALPLLLLGFVATLAMLLLGAAVFMALYIRQGMPPAVMFEPGIVAAVAHFMRLSLGAALIWAPILILSLAGLPRHWKHETW